MAACPSDAPSCLPVHMGSHAVGSLQQNATNLRAGLQIPVFPTEPTSAVAYVLTSAIFHEQLSRMRADVLEAASASGHQPAYSTSASNPSGDGTHPQTPRSTAEGGNSSLLSRPASPHPSRTPNGSPSPSVYGGNPTELDIRDNSVATETVPPAGSMVSLRREDSVGAGSRSSAAPVVEAAAEADVCVCYSVLCYMPAPQRAWSLLLHR
jgi:hypothetical protein